MSYQLPDAPYIREAEKFGMEEPEMRCPICGAVCEEVFSFPDGRPNGCNVCGDFMLSWGMFPRDRKVS